MKKHLRRIFGFIFAILIIIVSLFGVIPIKADTFNPNALLNVYSYNQNGDYWNCTISGYINNGIITNSDINDSFRIADNNTSITSIGVYVVECDIDIDLYTIITYEEITLNQYLTNYYNDGVNDGANGPSYQIGYESGFKDGVDSVQPNTAIYDEIYNKGVSDTEEYYSQGNLGYQQIYNQGAQSILDTIGDEENPNFLIMFKVIINWIRDFFLVGMDVNIFGINIGEFCLGVFMLSIFMLVLNFFRR